MKTFRQLTEKTELPHMMYDPKSGKGYKVKKAADHLRMKKLGYTHDKPDVNEESPLDRKQDRIDRTADLRKARLRHKDEIKKIREEISELSQMRPGSKMVNPQTLRRMKQLQKELDSMRNSAFGQSADKGDEDHSNEVKNSKRKDLRFSRDKFDGLPKSYDKYKLNKKPVMAAKESAEVDESLDEVLNMQQRIARGRMFKRHAKRNAVKRERKLRRKATQGDLLKRAEKAAKKVLIKKFTKGADKQDQSTSRKIEIEKRLSKMQGKIKAIAKKMMPVVRQREKERFGKINKPSTDARK